MGKEREKRARREFDRRLKDEPRQHAGRGLSQCSSGRVFDLYPPSGKLGCDPAGNRGIGRDKGRGFAGRLQRLAHRDRQRQAFFSLVVGDHDRDALKRGGEGQRRQRPPPFAPKIGRLRGTERFAQEGGARLKRRRGRAKRRDVLALDADRANQPMQQRLRMAREPERGVLAGADHRP